MTDGEHGRAGALAALEGAQADYAGFQASAEEILAGARNRYDRYQVDAWLRGKGVDLGAVPGNNAPAEHLSLAGLQAQLETTQAFTAGQRAAFRAALIEAAKEGYSTPEQRDAAFATLNLEPLQRVNRVSIEGRVTWSSQDAVDQLDLTQRLAQGLAGVAGKDVDITSVRLNVREVVE
jgi:hypothetical protein